MSKRNILLVGGSSGIGASLKSMLENEGENVYTLGRQVISSAGHLVFDAAQDSPIEIPENWPDQFGGFIYAPGTIQLKPFHRVTSDDFRKDFQINVLGFVQVLQSFLPKLKKANGASVVVFSTVATRVGLGFHASISTAKSALEGLALSLASELALSKIRVNVIAPSLTDTPLAASLLNTPEKLEASGKRHPLQRVGNADDMANAAAFLLSEKSSWVTGQILTIDGGLSRLRS
jgi:NAD(P)-dependent dehydrogenase (short-subunit alcohol dehydrogenase family)